MNRPLVGGAIHASPAELAQSASLHRLASSGHSHLKPAYRAMARDPWGTTVNTPRKAERAELTDADVVRLAQEGDAVAFERVYSLHSRRVYSLCLRMVTHPAEAEDLTQDVFLHLFRKIGTFRGESAFSTWLHRLAVNIVLMRLRRKRVAKISLDSITNPAEESDSRPMEFGASDLRLNGVIDRVNLQAAINELAPGYRAIFVLHDVQGFKHGEIAEIFGCSVGNSKSQLHKARTLLRQLLQKAQGNGAHQSRKSVPGSPAIGRLKQGLDYANA